MDAEEERRARRRRRDSVLRRLRRVEAAIEQWRVYEEDRARPLEARQGGAVPDLPLEACHELRRQLQDALARLER